jgi:hypothetical protein
MSIPSHPKGNVERQKAPPGGSAIAKEEGTAWLGVLYEGEIQRMPTVAKAA